MMVGNNEKEKENESNFCLHHLLRLFKHLVKIEPEHSCIDFSKVDLSQFTSFPKLLV